MTTTTRKDGRSPSHVRPPGCVRGLLNRADGSAKWTQESTIVLAGVYGPRPVGGKRENAERATLEVIWKDKNGQSGSGEREAEVILRRTLERVLLLSLHPRTIISVILQVIHDNGSVLGCALNASCAALVDAGLAMKGLVWGMSCAVMSKGVIVMDPTLEEEKAAQATVDMVFPSSPMSVRQKEDEGKEREEGLVTSVTRGSMSVDDYLTCVARGRAGAKHIGIFFRASLESYQVGTEMLEI